MNVPFDCPRNRRRWGPSTRLSCAGIAAMLATTPTAAEEASAPSAAQQRRAIPNYDGRDKPMTPTEVALWVPRIVLFPAYVVSEYVIRRPLGYAITAAERAELPAALYDFFTFGPDHKAGIVPVAFVDFGFNPSVGFYSFWDDVGLRGHDLRLSASTWGADWLSGRITERFRFSAERSLTLTATAVRRPDYAYYGLGPATREADLSRFGADRFEARALFRSYYWGASSVESSLGYRGVSFRPGSYHHDLSVTERAASGSFPLPPGFDSGYRAAFSGIRLSLDSRARTGGSESGVRLEFESEQAANLDAARASGWIRYGGSVGGFLDLDGNCRVVGLSLTALAADPLGTGPVPFTELVTLGGAAMMPGFRPGRLYGESALVATMRYSWPIWMWLDGSVQASVGNVYGAHWHGASWEKSRFSAALGFESNNSRDSIFQALVGFGTETFESGATVNSVRVVAGGRYGY